MDFGKKLQNLRKDKKLSQEQLAEKLNVSRQSVSKWESNQSYPEMEKLIDMAKIFNCTLDDLTNDEITIEKMNGAKQKNPVNDFITDISNTVNKSVKMFSSMNTKEIVKLIIFMVVIAIIIGILQIPINRLYHLCVNIFENFGPTAEGILSSILYLVLQLVYVIAGIIAFFYIYKIKYLDKYNENEENEKENIIEVTREESNVVFNEVIDDKKAVNEHRKSWTVLRVLGNILLFFIKTIAFFTAIPVIALFITFVVMFIVFIYLVIQNVSIIGLTVLLASLVGLTGLIIDLIFSFMFNKKLKVKKIFINFIVGLTLFGMGVGITAIEATKYTFINEIPSNYKLTKYTEIIEYKENMFFDHYGNVEFVVNEDMKDNIQIDIDYYEKLSTPKIEVLDNQIYIYSMDDEFNLDFIEDIVNNMKENKIYNYNGLIKPEYIVTLTAKSKTIELLKNNLEAHYKDETNVQNEISRIENEKKGCFEDYYELENNYLHLQEELKTCQREVEESKNALEEYKQNLREYLN